MNRAFIPENNYRYIDIQEVIYIKYTFQCNFCLDMSQGIIFFAVTEVSYWLGYFSIQPKSDLYYHFEKTNHAFKNLLEAL